MNITVKNTGCGLGDMLGRIDFVFKLSQYLNAEFYMPEVSSGLHGQNYGDFLGFYNYPLTSVNWKKDRIQIDLIEFTVNKFPVVNYGENVLVEVNFNHAIANAVSNILKLDQYANFDFKAFSKFYINKTSIKHEYLIHLRLGDNYIYKINDNILLDSGKRKIIPNDAYGDFLLNNQWQLNDIDILINYFEKNRINYFFLCDGFNSIYKHIDWTKTVDYIDNKLEILNAINNFEGIFLDKFKSNSFFEIGNSNIVSSINHINSSENIVFTTGGFAKRVSSYLCNNNPRHINIVDMINYIKST